MEITLENGQIKIVDDKTYRFYAKDIKAIKRRLDSGYFIVQVNRAGVKPNIKVNWKDVTVPASTSPEDLYEKFVTMVQDNEQRDVVPPNTYVALSPVSVGGVENVAIVTEVTKAQLDALVAANGLNEGLQYKVTDKDWLLIATSDSTLKAATGTIYAENEINDFSAIEADRIILVIPIEQNITYETGTPLEINAPVGYYPSKMFTNIVSGQTLGLVTLQDGEGNDLMKVNNIANELSIAAPSQNSSGLYATGNTANYGYILYSVEAESESGVVIKIVFEKLI